MGRPTPLSGKIRNWPAWSKALNRIELMFGRLKDWRRVAIACHRCAKTFLSAVALAATALFWL